MSGFNSHYEKVCYIMDNFDSQISELKPNYGYIEKLNLCTQIILLNNYLLPSDEIIIESLNLILSNGKEGQKHQANN